ncbi:MAG: hypothetical protein M3R46_05245 [Actinomycetota bacterium]|nr:hypothetical protein [Actinomycetota bacterium]MDQ3435580.1 hypothetical protein [Actinomycetota bacterium]
MSLQRIYDQRVFDDATTDERRGHVYVRSGELGLQRAGRAPRITARDVRGALSRPAR